MVKKLYSPMLAFPGKESDLRRKDMIYEIKFDGTRAICYVENGKVRFLNRRKKWIEYRYPELKEITSCINTNSCVLDGEIVVFGKDGRPDFRLLQQREHVESELVIKLLSKRYPACYVVFDILELEGKALLDKPLLERKHMLEDIFQDSKYARLSVYCECGEKLWKFVKEKGLEGVMAKKRDSPYVQKRSEFWLKIKTFKSMDCIIGGYTLGKGKRKLYFGALLIGAYTERGLHYLGRVGTGFDEKLLKLLKNMLEKIQTTSCPFYDFDEPDQIRKNSHFVIPKLVAEIKYLEITHDLKLRAPVFLRVRNDKPIEECVIDAI